MRIIRDYIRFGTVGTIGFLVDVVVLYSVAGLIGLFYGRAVSFLAAVLATWLLNRGWTFRHRSSGLRYGREFAVYLGFMLVGGAVNYTAYVWLVVSYQLALQYPVIGVAVGSLAGMLINFLASRFILFRHMDPSSQNFVSKVAEDLEVSSERK
jgi:putative flippase GtrA